MKGTRQTDIKTETDRQEIETDRAEQSLLSDSHSDSAQYRITPLLQIQPARGVESHSLLTAKQGKTSHGC